jgi:general secretion pathway protein D
MTTDTVKSLLAGIARVLTVTAAATLALGSASTAEAQLTPRGKPVLKTPARGGGAAAPSAAPSAPPPDPGKPDPTPAPGGTGAAGGRSGGATAPAGTTKKDPVSALAAPSEIEHRPLPGNTKVKFSLEDTDLPTLVKAVSEITGRRFIYGSKLHQIKVTVYSPETVSAAEAYAAFLSILNSNGMTVVPHGAYLEIVESQNASRQPTPIYGTASPVPAEDRFVTRLYRVNNIDAGEVAQLLGSNFKSNDGNITTYPPGNLLIITDTGSNIRRMLRIVEELDVGSAGDQLWVQPVYNSSATDAAAKLNEILGKGGKGAASVVVPDERTNSLIITATKNDYDKILELIKRVVDAPMVEGDNQIHVLPLQHAKCDELQGTISTILGGGGGARPGGGANRPAGGANRPAAPAGGAGGGAAGAAPEDIFEGNVRVSCDEATNSLLTTSSMRDYAQLRAVVDRLDQPRRQVFIEAVIMDLNYNSSLDLGIAYHGGAPFDVAGDTGAVYGGNNIGQSVTGLPAQLGALALGVRGPELEATENILGTGLSIPALGVVLHALGTDGNSNVLATPHIIATDNVEASIDVGQSVPLQTNVGGLGGLLGAAGGQAGGALGALGGLGGALGGLGGGFGAAPYRDVGIKLTIKPHVNDSDQVRLEIQEEISEVGSSPQGTLGAVTINQRSANTTLIVRDQQTVVIGGLMRDSETVSTTKVPILGDIPILGALFRQQTTSVGKTNLLLILTPYVVRDQGDLKAIFERKMQERQEFLDRYFVFNEDLAWKPPRDYTRANGLVETIRQTMLDMKDRERLENEIRPRSPKTHESVEPISLPAMAAPASSGGGSVSIGASGGSGGDSRPATSTSTSSSRPKVKPSVSPKLPSPAGGGDRVE